MCSATSEPWKRHLKRRERIVILVHRVRSRHCRRPCPCFVQKRGQSIWSCDGDRCGDVLLAVLRAFDRGGRSHRTAIKLPFIKVLTARRPNLTSTLIIRQSTVRRHSRRPQNHGQIPRTRVSADRCTAQTLSEQHIAHPANLQPQPSIFAAVSAACCC